MKTLYFVRHGKASLTSATGNDADRLLTDVGVERTRLIADYIADTNPEIDLIISSQAERAYSTALIIAHRLGISESKVLINELLFSGSDEVMIEIIRGLDDGVNKIMVVGHNPVISKVAKRFANKLNDWLPTTGVVSVNLDTETWAEIERAKATLNFIVWPGML